MDDYPLHHFNELDELTPQECEDVMIIDDRSTAEVLLRRVFLHALIFQTFDVHITALGCERGGDPSRIKFSLRSSTGITNFSYRGKDAKKIKEKLFNLTGTSSGASAADIIYSRFSILLPPVLARKFGLKLIEGEDFYIGDIRVVYQKTHGGYSFVCRILDLQRAKKLDEYQLSHAIRRTIKRNAKKGGIFLITGPTGSGKSSLLNATLGFRNDGQTAIHTLERPIELTILGDGPIKQVAIEGDITWPRGLQAALRSDPDVLMIVEINDRFTMETALQAAQSGHTVVATIHCNTAEEGFARTLDFCEDKKRDAYRLADTLKFIGALRLPNGYKGKLSNNKLDYELQYWLENNGIYLEEKDHIISIAGEKQYFDRIPLLEGIEVTNHIRDLIKAEAINADEIYKEARKQLHFETLAEAGMRACEQYGIELEKCYVELNTSPIAKEFPGLRTQLVREFGRSYYQISQAIDLYIETNQEAQRVDLRQFLRDLDWSSIPPIGKDSEK